LISILSAAKNERAAKLRDTIKDLRTKEFLFS
jgi:hypothetical protein